MGSFYLMGLCPPIAIKSQLLYRHGRYYRSCMYRCAHNITRACAYQTLTRLGMEGYLTEKPKPTALSTSSEWVKKLCLELCEKIFKETKVYPA